MGRVAEGFGWGALFALGFWLLTDASVAWAGAQGLLFAVMFILAGIVRTALKK